jgi:hypothetical protein
MALRQMRRARRRRRRSASRTLRKTRVTEVEARADMALQGLRMIPARDDCKFRQGWAVVERWFVEPSSFVCSEAGVVASGVDARGVSSSYSKTSGMLPRVGEKAGDRGLPT